jgi:hypothetical protein
VDVDEMVWGAYLELLEAEGRYMSPCERRELRRHRRSVMAAARLSVELNGDQPDPWTQLSLFTD